MQDSIEWAREWFSGQGWTVYRFQAETWKHMAAGRSGIINAPTGSGKTYAALIPVIDDIRQQKTRNAIVAIWIIPIRALAQEIYSAGKEITDSLFPDISIAIRTGDTPASERQKFNKTNPDILVTTPESLHHLFTGKDLQRLFRSLRFIIIDEWHEFIGSKRGVQIELAISRLRGIRERQGEHVQIWGISATIGNMQQAMAVLHGPKIRYIPELIQANIPKKINIHSILPGEMERLPWAGHLGIKMIDQLLPILKASATTLLFTNTRSQAEIWYHALLDKAPSLAGWIALHHGSLSREVRQWVEDALEKGELKVVICTSSLDLGVDFKPVETVVQVGSPKGIARFLQRAGRSGHAPGAESNIYFLPTHALELLESAALKYAVEHKIVEDKIPYIRCFDVLVQYLVTLAIGDGFYPEEIRKEALSTFAYQSLSEQEWQWALNFIQYGGHSLEAYDEFRKVVTDASGRYYVDSRKVALRHRLSMGTIASETSMQVKFISGGHIGTVEDSFVSKLKPGDVFWFGGRSLEFDRIFGNTLYVRKSKQSKGIFPSWLGGRMPLTSHLSALLRMQIAQVSEGIIDSEETEALLPIFLLQSERSAIPSEEQLLVEYFKTREGYHLMFFPFEGRLVHEGMATLIAYRISKLLPVTFSIAFNDYGFELLADTACAAEAIITPELFSDVHLTEDILSGFNAAEMAKRKFKDIAQIAGLVFRGYPGREKKERHLVSSAELYYKMFKEYDPDNLLFRQALDEALTYQLEEYRLREAMRRIQLQTILLTRPPKPTPFAFPILVERFREKLSSEKLSDRIRRMTVSFQ